MKSNRILQFFILFLFFVPQAFASQEKQGGGAAITNQLEGMGYAYKLYDATNGLPTSDANTILSTQDGFIWIGGYSGLIRYDGARFERQDSSTGITSVNALYEDSHKRLWIGTNDNGVIYTSKNEFRHYTYEDGLRSSTVRTITEDYDHTIYIGTTQGVAYIDQNMKLHTLNDIQIDNAYVAQLASDGLGSIYGITRNGTVFCIKNRKVTSYYNGWDLGIGDITAVYPDSKKVGAVYLGTSTDIIAHGSFERRFEDITTINVAPAANIGLITKASGRIWVISDRIAGYLDENEDFVPLENFPLTSSIGTMTEDYEGNLWFTSFRQGVVKVVANQFTDISSLAELPSTVVNSTCMHQNHLYIGTDYGLQILDRQNNRIENDLTKFLDNARIRCIEEDAQRNLWISTYTGHKGLVCYTFDGRIKTYTTDNGLPADETRGTAITSNGSVLLATNNGFAVLRHGEVIKSYGANSGVNSSVILTVAEGPAESYYLGTDGGGIYIIDGNNIRRIGRQDGLTSEVILRIKKDTKRNLYWIITSNSIAYMKDEKIFTVEQFPYSNNYDIFFDNSDNAWILASNGIYVVKVQDMINNRKIDYLFYDTSSGLPTVPTGNSFSAIEKDGTLYISGRTGVSRVNINRYFEKTHDIKLIVPYVDADEVRYYPDRNNKVTLPASAKVVTIYSYALTYSMRNPKIKYQLEGFDKEPLFVNQKNLEPVRYTNLDGGNYTFNMSLLNNSTNQIQQTFSIKITKTKAFYETNWFWLIVTAVWILFIFFLAQRYIHQKIYKMEKKAEENKEFVNAIIGAFANCVDGKDVYTNGHSRRVAKYTKMLAQKLGESDEAVEKFYNIALMHDIGKIGIPDAILQKPGKLTPEEYEIMKSHAQKGYEILKDVKLQDDLADGAHYHHERLDGNGYPDGLVGDNIPWVARVISVADTFDAMSSTRPYRKKLPMNQIIEEIKCCAGTQFDPLVVKKFLELYEEGAFDDLK